MHMDSRNNVLRQTTINQKEAGFILIMVMLLLTILSLSAFVAVEQSQFSYKVNHTRVSKMKARNISEDARLSALNKLVSLIQNNDLTIENSQINKALDRYKKEGIRHFLSVNHKSERAEVYVKQLPVQALKNGVSLVQNMAYSALGMGLGNQESFAARYELRAKGIAHDKGSDVTFWTASDYRFTP